MKNNNIINNLIDYIENNLENHLRLDEISEIAGYSKFHLNRIFTEQVGCTIYKYVQMRRLTIAAEKLVYTDVPISEISYEAGYNSQQAFTLAFRQIYGCPPQEYRIINIFKPKYVRYGANDCKAYYKMYMMMGAAA